MVAMEGLFAWVNSVLHFVGPLSDFFWDFPTMFGWYKSLPLLGSFSLAILVLVGSGVYFTLRLGFVQVTQLGRGIRLLARRQQVRTGISPLAAFLLSSAMRVGPGNILGVTGAIAVGGPGALFWMWVSGFFGMATAFVEATLAQLFKERRGGEFVGGLPFYGRELLGGKKLAGILLSCLYIFYALGCLPKASTWYPPWEPSPKWSPAALFLPILSSTTLPPWWCWSLPESWPLGASRRLPGFQ